MGMCSLFLSSSTITISVSPFQARSSIVGEADHIGIGLTKVGSWVQGWICELVCSLYDSFGSPRGTSVVSSAQGWSTCSQFATTMQSLGQDIQSRVEARTKENQSLSGDLRGLRSGSFLMPPLQVGLSC